MLGAGKRGLILQQAEEHVLKHVFGIGDAVELVECEPEHGVSPCSHRLSQKLI